MIFRSLLVVLAGSHALTATPALAQLSRHGPQRGEPCVQQVLVTAAADAGPGSLRQAMVDVCDGGTVEFSERFVIALESEIVVDKAVTLDGTSRSAAASATQDNLVQILGGQDHRSFSVTAAGDLTIRRLRISGGSVGSQGGAILNRGRLAIIECRLDGNSVGATSALGGGAVFSAFQSTLWVDASTFDGNDAVRGSALFNEGTAELRNSTFSANLGTTREGAIQNRGVLWAEHITVAGNGALDAGFGGLFAFRAETTLINSILSDNIGSDCSISDGEIAVHAVLARSGNCGAQFRDDPLLQALGANGGPTQTLALPMASPAVDAADPEFCPDTDQRGHLRPKGEGCDLGAFERIALFKNGFDEESGRPSH